MNKTSMMIKPKDIGEVLCIKEVSFKNMKKLIDSIFSQVFPEYKKCTIDNFKNEGVVVNLIFYNSKMDVPMQVGQVNFCEIYGYQHDKKLELTQGAKDILLPFIPFPLAIKTATNSNSTEETNDFLWNHLINNYEGNCVDCQYAKIPIDIEYLVNKVYKQKNIKVIVVGEKSFNLVFNTII